MKHMIEVPCPTCGQKTLQPDSRTDTFDERMAFEQAWDARFTALAALEAVVPEIREKAWDEGAEAAGGYGHEDDWTQDMNPFLDNPYRHDTEDTV